MKVRTFQVRFDEKKVDSTQIRAKLKELDGVQEVEILSWKRKDL